MLAKGWLIGLQFETALTAGLYFDLAAHANRMSAKLRAGFANCGIAMAADSPTNQIFPILPVKAATLLREKYIFLHWDDVDAAHEAVRFVCSWATKECDVDAFLIDLNAALA